MPKGYSCASSSFATALRMALAVVALVIAAPLRKPRSRGVMPRRELPRCQRQEGDHRPRDRRLRPDRDRRPLGAHPQEGLRQRHRRRAASSTRRPAPRLGFGLHIMDFLMAPGWRDDGYERDPKVHGNLPKHYVEGPQICTQAKELPVEIIRGEGLRRGAAPLHVHTSPARATRPARPGSRRSSSSPACATCSPPSGSPASTTWTTCSTASTCPATSSTTRQRRHLRAGLPQLPRQAASPPAAFTEDFGPDEKFLYQRKDGQVPERMIRAYQVKLDGKPGPVAGRHDARPGGGRPRRGATSAATSRFIEELHRRHVKAGETFGAAYVVGWFDDVPQMQQTYDRYKGRDADRPGGREVQREVAAPRIRVPARTFARPAACHPERSEGPLVHRAAGPEPKRPSAWNEGPFGVPQGDNSRRPDTGLIAGPVRAYWAPSGRFPGIAILQFFAPARSSEHEVHPLLVKTSFARRNWNTVCSPGAPALGKRTDRRRLTGRGTGWTSST